MGKIHLSSYAEYGSVPYVSTVSIIFILVGSIYHAFFMVISLHQQGKKWIELIKEAKMAAGNLRYQVL